MEMALPVVLLGIGIHLLTHLLVPLNMRFSTRLGILAHPGERKIHNGSIPEAGGLSFALPIILSQIVLALFLPQPERGRMFWLAGVEVATLILGFMDDRHDTRAWLKFLLQIGIGVAMYLIGFRVESLTNPFGSEIMLGWASFPVTLLWYLVVMNAINLIDGIDGLASGICAIVCAVLLIVGIKGQNLIAAALSAFLMAGNLAFLRFNFHPAKIFLGDTGALFNGLVIAAIATTGTQQYKGITSMTLIIPLSVLAIPLIDISLAVLRRLRFGNIFVADKAHLHHAMLGLGLSQKAISLIAWVVTLLFGLIAIGFSFSTKRILFLVLWGLLALGVILAYVVMQHGRKK